MGSLRVDAMNQLEANIQRTIPLTASTLIAAAMTAAGCASLAAEEGHAGAPAAGEVARSAPTRTGHADVPGARIYYQVHGDLNARKVPLLILHGAYMSADAMAPMIRSFAASRAVIATDARGHGRNGDAPGPLTYELLADDAAGVLKALNVSKADVLGYSMGANTALLMAIRHPDRVDKLIVLSGTYRHDGYYPEVLEAFERVTPQNFAGTPLEAEYRRLSPTPNAFPTLVAKVTALQNLPQAWPEEAIRAITGKTMVVVGDADGVDLEHAVKLFKLRGGGDVEVAAVKGFMDRAPRARLAILPATSHIGIMAQANLIADLATPFLDDVTPPIPPGFLPEGNARATQGTTSEPTRRDPRPRS